MAPDTLTERQKQWLLLAADGKFDAGYFTGALEMYRHVSKSFPEDVEARTGLALSLMHVGRYEEAAPLLTQLQHHMPQSPQLQLMVAECLYRSSRLPEAEACLRDLAAREPGYVEANSRLGRVCMDMQKYPEANAAFSQALALDPGHLESLICMAIMMIKFCQFDDALTVLGRAHDIEPRNVLVLNNLGRACKMMGRHDKALRWYREALAAEPDSACVIGNYLFALNYCAEMDPVFVAQEHFRLAPRYLADGQTEAPPGWARAADRRLRIGYVSGDFYTHSVAYFLEPILIHHDYERFDIFCYSLGATIDATTERIKQLPCTWRDMTASPPDDLALRIREDAIDILVDLAGHTADNRLGTFARRPAPLQVSWIGYPNTSGLPQMDYYLTDGQCDPPGMTDHLFSERLWRLPRIFCCYFTPVEFPPITGSPAAANGYVTFGSFNNFAKVTTSHMGLWARILREVPRSRLYLKSMALGDESVKQEVLARFAAEGIDQGRISMRTVATTPLEHLKEYTAVDIALDTFPYQIGRAHV